MKKIIYYIFKVIVIFLAFIGISVISISVHELKHYYDVKGESEVVQICVLNLPTKAQYVINTNYSSIGYVKHIGEAKSSEFMAHLVEIPVMFLLTLITLAYFLKLSKPFYENEIS